MSSGVDDGLLLNFAAAPSGSSRQPISSAAGRGRGGKEAQQSSRKSFSNRRGDGQSSAPGGSIVQKQSNYGSLQSVARQQSQATDAETNYTSKSRLRAGQDQHLGARQSESSRNGSGQASTQSRGKTTGKDASKENKQGKRDATGVISSLFDRSETLAERKSPGGDEDVVPRAAPTNAPSIDSAFPKLGLEPLLSSHLASDKMGIKRPTSIQSSALPILLYSQRSESSAKVQRDALIHAQTGSGKTLAYLLPIVQSLLPLCETSWIDRSCLGTLAIVLAPTRELAQQIYEVLESLANLPLTNGPANGASGEEPHEGSIRRTRWIVPGLLSGGATKNHEKSRLRKGLPIIVATPGRLLDHLRNTAALDVGRLQWLVLDEADRLLEMGFEQTLNDIMKAIDGRRRAACEAQRIRIRDELGNQVSELALQEWNIVDTFGEAWWRFPRRTILCSATLDEGVQVLAGKSLNNPHVIRDDGKSTERDDVSESAETDKQKFSSAPAQLVQNVVVAPTKQRLVTLVALLRRAMSKSKECKVMVFLSCTDSVDFHLQVLAGVNMARGAGTAGQQEQGSISVDMTKRQHSSQLLPSATMFRLHGSMAQQERFASLKQFTKSKEASILFCTSVASRGLDLDVSHVIQLDPPTEKGTDEYLHRIGRTARAGQDGESWLVLLPNEDSCVERYEREMSSRTDADEQATAARPHIHRRDVASVLRDGFGSVNTDMQQIQTRATDAQMALERWTLARDGNAQLARRAYLSHLRAYATHPPSERSIFAIARLQLGHLAKAFALREAPGDIRARAQAAAIREKKSAQSSQEARKKGKADSDASAKRKRRDAATEQATDLSVDGGLDSDESSNDEDNRYSKASLQFQRNKDTEARMYAKVREMGSLHKRQGILGEHGGASEFQIA